MPHASCSKPVSHPALFVPSVSHAPRSMQTSQHNPPHFPLRPCVAAAHTHTCHADRKSPVPFEAPMRCTAPEVEAAREAGTAVVVTDGSADMWALGVLAYELLTQSSVFPPGVPVSTVRKMVLGRVPLPWEEQGNTSDFAEDVQVCPPVRMLPPPLSVAVAVGASTPGRTICELAPAAITPHRFVAPSRTRVLLRVTLHCP